MNNTVGKMFRKIQLGLWQPPDWFSTVKFKETDLCKHSNSSGRIHSALLFLRLVCSYTVK